MTRFLPVVVSLGCLLAFGAASLWSDRSHGKRAGEAAVESCRESGKPPSFVPAASNSGASRASAIDPKALFTVLSKREARKLVNLFRTAVRLGRTDLASPPDPRLVLEKLSEGVAGPGEIVLKFPGLSPQQAETVLSYVYFEGSFLVYRPEAKFTPEEERIWSHLTSCQDGNCPDHPRLRSIRDLISQSTP